MYGSIQLFMSLFYPIYFLFLVSILLSCKPNNQDFTTIQEPPTDTLSQEKIAYDGQEAYDIHSHGDVILNNVPTRIMLIADSSMTTEAVHGSRLNIVDYLYPLGFTSEAKKITIESGEEILLLRYFSGGAHCCFVYEAFRYDEGVDAFRYLDQFYCEECEGLELKYPIPYWEWMDYFYCSYAGGREIDCRNSEYITFMHIVDDVLVARAKGDIKVMEQCFIDYCKVGEIPELNMDGEDTGEREAVLNHLYWIYTLHLDIDKVKKLYFRHIPDLVDKGPLWAEIEMFILSNRIIIDSNNHQNDKL